MTNATRIGLVAVIVGAAAAFHFLPMAFSKSAAARKEEADRRSKELADRINRKD